MKKKKKINNLEEGRKLNVVGQWGFSNLYDFNYICNIVLY